MVFQSNITMIATDSYRAQLHATIAALRYWAPGLRPAAEIEDEESASHWRLAARPHVANACAFELVLQPAPRFDILVGDEAYEDVPLESFDLFLPLLTAIAQGRLVQRTAVSRNTGAWRTIETLVTMADGTIWRGERVNEALAHALAPVQCMLLERHFVPYLREDGSHGRPA